MSSENQSKQRNQRKRAKDEICRLISSTAALERAAQPATAESQPLNLCVRDHRPQRRRQKRSAIFLPPEKLANDVCICKFKFVAGSEPRLQEKKILSIDAGGNFRFFPESLKKTVKKVPALLPIETVFPPVDQPPSTGAESLPTGLGAKITKIAKNTQNGDKIGKKLSRRQKMEKTFGEQGFLIQTQHVAATQGSAFCKFRQLKKFTRYLYRSWKHYLPEETQPLKG